MIPGGGLRLIRWGTFAFLAGLKEWMRGVDHKLMQPPISQMDEEWADSFEGLQKKGDDVLDILARVKIFEALSNEELRQVERIVHRRIYLPQEAVVRQGAPGVGMYIIQNGSTDVLLEVGNGEMIRLATLSDGHFFGEMSLLDGAPRAASVVATERSHIIGFFRADLMDLIQRSPRLGFKIVFRISLLMVERLRETLKEYRAEMRELRGLEAAKAEGER